MGTDGHKWARVKAGIKVRFVPDKNGCWWVRRGCGYIVYTTGNLKLHHDHRAERWNALGATGARRSRRFSVQNEGGPELCRLLATLAIEAG